MKCSCKSGKPDDIGDIGDSSREEILLVERERVVSLPSGRTIMINMIVIVIVRAFRTERKKRVTPKSRNREVWGKK